jgi:hypothetical protein
MRIVEQGGAGGNDFKSSALASCAVMRLLSARQATGRAYRSSRTAAGLLSGGMCGSPELPVNTGSRRVRAGHAVQFASRLGKGQPSDGAIRVFSTPVIHLSRMADSVARLIL